MLLVVLTVSDRCSQGLQSDVAGPAVASLLHNHWPTAEIRPDLVACDEDQIAEELTAFAHTGAALILTLGGTGLGPRDRTPEATARVLDREVPGIAEAIRAHGAETTPSAWLLRGIAGMRNGALIVNLPSTPRAATESLTAILPLLDHALAATSPAPPQA